jgi:hypothetical protein
MKSPAESGLGGTVGHDSDGRKPRTNEVCWRRRDRSPRVSSIMSDRLAWLSGPEGWLNRRRFPVTVRSTPYAALTEKEGPPKGGRDMERDDE